MTTLLFLAVILTFEILPVSSTSSSQITTGEISIIGKGSLEAGSALILSCTIPNFTEPAQWKGETHIYTTCIPDFCTNVRTENYTFGSNASGIFVTTNPLSMADNGTIWMCNYQDYTTSYTIMVQSTFVPPPGEFRIVGKGSFEAGSALLLSCIIPAFTGSASLSRENVVYTICIPDACDTNPMVNYTFASNKSGIFVTIYPLEVTDSGTKWHCNHNFDNTFYTLFVQPSITIYQPPTESTIAQPPGEFSIVGKGSFEAGSTLLLSCIIPRFTESASWYRDNVLYAMCSADTCSTIPMGNYIFASNTSGVFVTIYPLTIAENGTEWNCNHIFDHSVYTVFVQPSITNNQPPTGSCQKPYQKIGNGCYSIHDDSISGDEAFASCTDTGAYLANFETVEEAMFMKVFLQRNKTGISYFVGGRNVNRYLSSGDWRWIKHGNATKMTYFAFAPGQPSWSAEKGEDCMFFYANDRYNFYNVMCDNGHFLGGFICEI